MYVHTYIHIITTTDIANEIILCYLQLVEVFSRSVPWLGMDSIIRLIKSYDPQYTGLVRFVRITTTLLATIQPAMIELASTFNRVRAKIHITEENKEDNELMAELIMIRFLHSLYEECSGGTEWKMVPSAAPSEVQGGPSNESKQLELHSISSGTSQVSTESTTKKKPSNTPAYTMKKVPVGMKLEDLPEMFSCCVSCVEDELLMDKRVQQMIEYFYSEAQKKSFLMQSTSNFATASLSANRMDIASNESSRGGNSSISNSMLKYPLVKSSVVLSRISQEELIEALQLPQHKEFLREFIRQVRTFRKLAAPFIFKSSVSLDDSIEQFSISSIT